MDIFKFDCYRSFIKAKINENQSLRGYQGQLAETAMCQKSYLSNVLSNRASLNQEQVMRLAIFWRLEEDETEYLLELVSLDKTTFKPLKEQINKKLKRLKKERENLSKKIQKSKKISSEDKSTYYSSWIWSAIHVLVGISHFQTPSSISKRLNLPEKLVNEHLQKLLDMGLVTFNSKSWDINPGHFHLSKESSWTAINHKNWRERAVIDSQFTGTDGLHYTCVQSHSLNDFYEIKNLLLDFLDKNRTIIAPSPKEEVYSLCFDFFRIV